MTMEFETVNVTAAIDIFLLLLSVSGPRSRSCHFLR